MKSITRKVFRVKRYCTTQNVQNFSTTKIAQVSSSKNIISGPKLDPIVGMTVPELVFADISKHENSPAFTCGLSNRSYTYKQIYGMSHGFAAALKEHGLKPGETVGILLPNLPEYPIIKFGVWLAGGVVSPISPTFTPDEVCRQCKIAQTKIIVTMPLFLKLIASIKPNIPEIKSVINVGSEPEPATHAFFEMVKANWKGVEFLKGSSIDTTQQLAMLPFSSGTTGPPKGVMLTHSNICTNVNQFSQPDCVKRMDEERLIELLPFYHCYGSGCLITAPMTIGAHVRTLPKFNPEMFIQSLRIHKPTALHLVAPIIQFLSLTPEIKKSDFDSVHTVVVGATPCGKMLVKAFLARTGKFIFFQEGYGMTELTVVSHVCRLAKKNDKIGSIGQLVGGTSCKVVDIETGEALPHNKRGELLVKGPQVMQGYINNEVATKETIDSDGWLRTGDIAMYDEQKSFYIVDRLKELIKVKGLQVSPSELEDLLRGSIDIKDVAVIGVPDPKLGEAPRAYIVRKTEKLNESKVHDFLERKIAPHKKLAGGIEFVNEIPRATSGKILRRILLDDYLKRKP